MQIEGKWRLNLVFQSRLWTRLEGIAFGDDAIPCVLEQPPQGLFFSVGASAASLLKNALLSRAASGQG